MNQENNQSEQKNKKSNIKESQNTIKEINKLNMKEIPNENDENKKEDSLPKNNKYQNSRYNNNDINEEEFPFQKKYSAEIPVKNALNEDEEEEEDWVNPLAKKSVLTSQKKIAPKGVLNFFKGNAIPNNNINENKNNEDNSNKFSEILKKNENSFYYVDNNNNNNNNLKTIKSGEIKNPINIISEKLNEKINAKSKNEQLKNNHDKNDNIQQLKKDLFARKLNKCCLLNVGDTSYLNAILQCLANIDFLINFFLNENIEKHLNENIKTLPLSFVTLRLFKHFYIKKDSKYSLESFLRVLGSLNPIYLSSKIRNANECLIFILETLHNELNRIKIINHKNDFNKKVRKEVIDYGIFNYKNKYDCIISDIFNWHQLKELHCMECGEVSYDFQTFNTIQLDSLNFKKTIGKNSITIFDCLNYELNLNKKIICKYCNKNAHIKNISYIYSSPKIFVFLLNSGDFNEELLDLNFNLETTINLNKYIENKQSPKKYELIGIISIDINNKKYLNYCKSFEDKNWYFYYDEDVAQIQEKQVVMDNNGKFIPSVLFYRSIDG